MKTPLISTPKNLLAIAITLLALWAPAFGGVFDRAPQSPPATDANAGSSRWELQVRGLISFESLLGLEEDLRLHFPENRIRLVSCRLTPEAPAHSLATWEISGPAPFDAYFPAGFRVTAFTATFAGHDLRARRLDAATSPTPIPDVLSAGPRGFR
ncbi:MAG: hypothetical protein AB7O66_16605 [Limisphaerales bacterium]